MTELQYYFHIELPNWQMPNFAQTMFPKWPGIVYLPDHNLARLLRVPDNRKCLIASDTLIGPLFVTVDERCRRIATLAKMFPGAKVLLGFRPHGDFLASLYSQYLSMGGQDSLAEVVSLSGSIASALWRAEDLNYRAIIEAAEAAFRNQPFVYSAAELKTNAAGLISDMADYFETPVPSGMKFKVVNDNLGRWQGRLLREFNRTVAADAATGEQRRCIRHLWRSSSYPEKICRRILNKLPAEPLISDEMRAEIGKVYQGDWQYVCEYIEALPLRRTDRSI